MTDKKEQSNNTSMTVNHSLPKHIEKELMHISNENLYKKGVISREVFLKAKAKIDKL